MRTRLGRRLDRLAAAAEPGGCRWAGGRCCQQAVVGDGSDDPPLPELPNVCPACGKLTLWRVVVLVGVDATRI